MNILDFIKKILKEIVLDINPNLEEKKINIEIPKDNKNGDIATNIAMVYSRDLNQKPIDLANKIKDKLLLLDYIDSIEIAGPGFINIFLSENIFLDFLNQIDEKTYKFPKQNKTIVIDYSSPNIPKKLHIGHIRSTIIGDSIKRIYNFLGYDIIADNHLGDWGTQFGKMIIAYKNKWMDGCLYQKDKILAIEKAYVRFGTEAEKNPHLEEEARIEVKKLQDGNEENKKIWKELLEISIDDCKKIYERLDIHFDTFHGESFYQETMEEIVKILKSNGISKESEGAEVVFFEEQEHLPPCIVQKKDGAYLYATSDLATIKYRIDKYNAYKTICLTDERQINHFKQVFKIKEMLGWKINTEHIWFGTISTKEGAFSTRKGNVIYLEDLINESINKSKNIIAEKNPNLTEEELQEISEIIGIGTIKYADLSQNKQSPIIFDWEKMLSFDGNTALYIEYTFARINSIIIKNDKIDNNIKNIEKEEKEIIKILLNFPNTVLEAGESYKPNLIAEYLFNLCKEFNGFYTNYKISGSPNKLYICRKTLYIIKTGLDLLGIKTIKKI